mgnify:CR=1 FL=1
MTHFLVNLRGGGGGSYAVVGWCACTFHVDLCWSGLSRHHKHVGCPHSRFGGAVDVAGVLHVPSDSVDGVYVQGVGRTSVSIKTER